MTCKSIVFMYNRINNYEKGDIHGTKGNKFRRKILVI